MNQHETIPTLIFKIFIKKTNIITEEKIKTEFYSNTKKRKINEIIKCTRKEGLLLMWTIFPYPIFKKEIFYSHTTKIQ